MTSVIFQISNKAQWERVERGLHSLGLKWGNCRENHIEYDFALGENDMGDKLYISVEPCHFDHFHWSNNTRYVSLPKIIINLDDLNEDISVQNT